MTIVIGGGTPPVNSELSKDGEVLSDSKER